MNFVQVRSGSISFPFEERIHACPMGLQTVLFITHPDHSISHSSFRVNMAEILMWAWLALTKGRWAVL